MRLIVALAFALLAAAARSSAQVPDGTGQAGSLVTRDALERQHRAAIESVSIDGVSRDVRERKRHEASEIEERLRDGDFRLGDRIVFELAGEPSLSDTLVVRTGLIVRIGTLDSVSLQGVLRSEVQQHLTAKLTKYFKDPKVKAAPLVRLAVTGGVLRNGYFHVRPDITLSDLIMSAGGPTPKANLDQVTIRRDGRELMKVSGSTGVSLDQLGVRGGDELVVAEKHGISWMNIVQGAGILLGVAVAIVGLSN
jgi:hypothetical protein